jgi:hypothetical protein
MELKSGTVRTELKIGTTVFGMYVDLRLECMWTSLWQTLDNHSLNCSVLGAVLLKMPFAMSYTVVNVCSYPLIRDVNFKRVYR